MCYVYLFFFKQKTAYEMRISDWSSDVCSSDLMTKRYHAEVPDFLRPSTVRANSKELKFDKLDSGYTVATAGSDTVGRGETLQAAHLSEVGLWPKGKAKDIMNGLLQAIPNEDDTFVFVESTARDMSDRKSTRLNSSH